MGFTFRRMGGDTAWNEKGNKRGPEFRILWTALEKRHTLGDVGRQKERLSWIRPEGWGLHKKLDGQGRNRKGIECNQIAAV